jgi:hypothetical protein
MFSAGVPKRTILAMIAGLLGAYSQFCPTSALAEDFQLFKVVSSKDEVVIGVASSDIGNPVNLARFVDTFKQHGKIEVWRYATKKDTSGDLVQAPQMRIVLVWGDTLRIEPYTSPLKVVAP